MSGCVGALRHSGKRHRWIELMSVTWYGIAWHVENLGGMTAQGQRSHAGPENRDRALHRGQKPIDPLLGRLQVFCQTPPYCYKCGSRRACRPLAALRGLLDPHAAQTTHPRPTALKQQPCHSEEALPHGSATTRTPIQI